MRIGIEKMNMYAGSLVLDVEDLAIARKKDPKHIKENLMIHKKSQNVDFEDVRTVMQDGGTAIMGSATAEGEERATKAVSQALASPLLNDNDINGAKYILLNITSGEDEISMDEIDEITVLD